jgi:hypothetical protein
VVDRLEGGQASWSAEASVGLTALRRGTHPASRRRRLRSIAATDQDAANALGSIPGAFGVSTLLQLRAEARRLAPLPVGGVAPGLAALANGSYPYGKTLYLVARGESTVAVRQYLDFLASPAGRKLLTGLGLDVSPGLTAAVRSSAR